MKFCRNLQRIIDITDPEWAPYWTNYKMLKKFLKQLPSLVPSDAGTATLAKEDPDSDTASTHLHDDVEVNDECEANDNSTSDQNVMDIGEHDPEHIQEEGGPIERPDGRRAAAKMSRNPGEVAFFKLLNSELKKAIHFFDKALVEFDIREARVREGTEIMKKANSLMVNEKWTLMAKSLYRLYKDLLLLEIYAIMTYCSFSKILKKHDKVTGHNTRIAFMKNVVNKANFTHYPKLMQMITRIESMYEEVSQSLINEGKSGLYEDERLFINMIHRLNEQVLDTKEEEGAPDVGERKQSRRQSQESTNLGNFSPTSPHPSPHPSEAVSTLRSLVEENALNKSSKEGLAKISEAEKEKKAKRQLMADSPPSKRTRTSP